MSEFLRGHRVPDSYIDWDLPTFSHVVESDESCADCLCRVCARNVCNDSFNKKVENGRTCTCIDCCIGDWYPSISEDCTEFLPDEDAE